MALFKASHEFLSSVILKSFCVLLLAVLAWPALAADPSGWSDKTLCRVMDGDPNNADYQVEAKRRQVSCKDGVVTSQAKANQATTTKKQAVLKVNQGVQFYPLELSPAIKDELLSVAINKTDFDFSDYQLAYFEKRVDCVFDLRRVQYGDVEEGRIEGWNMAEGMLVFSEDQVKVDGRWKMGGLSKDPSYMENEINLKLTLDGHLVGKMAYFHLNISEGEALRQPLYIELTPHKRSQPFDIQNPTKAQIWTEVEDWAGGVWRVHRCF